MDVYRGLISELGALVDWEDGDLKMEDTEVINRVFGKWLSKRLKKFRGRTVIVSIDIDERKVRRTVIKLAEFEKPEKP